jgi:hypothetical protein
VSRNRYGALGHRWFWALPSTSSVELYHLIRAGDLRLRSEKRRQFSSGSEVGGVGLLVDPHRVQGAKHLVGEAATTSRTATALRTTATRATTASFCPSRASKCSAEGL